MLEGPTFCQSTLAQTSDTARNLDGENLNFKGYEKKKWTHPRFLHRGPKKAVEQDSDVHFDLT